MGNDSIPLLHHLFVTQFIMDFGTMNHTQGSDDTKEGHKLAVFGSIGDRMDIVKSLSSDAKFLFGKNIAKGKDRVEGDINDFDHGMVGR